MAFLAERQLLSSIISSVVKKNIDDILLGSDDSLLGNDDILLGNDDSLMGNDEILLDNDDILLGSDDSLLGDDDSLLGNDDSLLGSDDSLLGNDDILLGDVATEQNVYDTRPDNHVIKQSKHDILRDVSNLQVGGVAVESLSRSTCLLFLRRVSASGPCGLFATKIRFSLPCSFSGYRNTAKP